MITEEISKERKEIDVLIDRGFIVKTPITSVLRIFGGKFRIWRVKFMPLGLMDLQTDLFLQLQADEEKIYTNDLVVRNNEIMNSVKDNAKLCAEIVAITILRKKWRIKLFRKLFSNYLYWRVNSKELYDFTLKIYKMNDYQNFMTSIILLKAKRTTRPIAEMNQATKADMIE